MEKNQKIAEVAVLKETLASATSAVVIEFKGLVVGKDTAFRKSVRDSKAQYRVSKNTLLRLAVKDTSFEALGGSFKGSSAIATTTTDVVAMAKAIKEIKAGKVEYRVDKTGIIHAGVGKLSFGVEKLEENAKALIDAVHKAKPATAKGKYVKTMYIASTMGPSVTLNTSVEK